MKRRTPVSAPISVMLSIGVGVVSTGQGLASCLCKARFILLAELGSSFAFLAPRRLEQPASIQSCGSVEFSFSFSLLSGCSCCQNSEVWLSCVPGCGNPCAMKTLVILRVRPFYAAVGCWRWWHAAGGGEAKFSGASHSARGVTRPRTAEHTECAVWIHIVCMPTLAALCLGLLPLAVRCLDVTDCSRMLVFIGSGSNPGRHILFPCPCWPLPSLPCALLCKNNCMARWACLHGR